MVARQRKPSISDYVALHWLEWNGGALRLTTRRKVCDQLKAET
jgi:hypothetical protein